MITSAQKKMIHPAILVFGLLGVIAGLYAFPVHAAGWKCPAEEVVSGSCTWTARGCLVNDEGTYMCFFTPSGTGCQSSPTAPCEETMGN